MGLGIILPDSCFVADKNLSRLQSLSGLARTSAAVLRNHVTKGVFTNNHMKVSAAFNAHPCFLATPYMDALFRVAALDSYFIELLLPAKAASVASPKPQLSEAIETLL